MPIYEYECSGCAHRFELKRKFSETSAVSCPKCGRDTQKVFAPTPIIFKGPGFYVTDYRKAPPASGKTE